MNAMNSTIGQAIKDRVEAIGMSKAELARRLHMSPANVHKIFKRPSLDIEMLRRMGEILQYDFISHYCHFTTHTAQGKYVLFGARQESRTVYPYSMRIKMLLLQETTHKLLVAEPTQSISQFVQEIDLIRHGLEDIWSQMHTEK